ncbi:MAG TPA: hypothetical protein VGU26_08960, partial [Gaiellaceae bacterium]|nr:hypothetical protein [Gaiellaceae bacterium]
MRPRRAGCGLVWQQAIHGAGGQLGRVDACARYGVGSLVNSFAPAHLGDLTRTVLLLEALPGGARLRLVTPFATVQATRVATLGGLVLAGMLPPRLAPLGLLPVLIVFGIRRSTSRLIVLSLGSSGLKIAAVASALAAVAIPSPLRAAFVVVPALELAGLLPLTPG